MNRTLGVLSLLFLMSLVFFTACNKDDDGGGGFVNELLFPVENDVQLGLQLDSAIEADPTTYPILSRTAYPEAYGHIERIRDSVLATSDIVYRDLFTWEVHIIHDDNVLNAFAAPGGFIYVYTGLIKYLDTEDELAGVMGHEIAHADRRHSINQMKKQYGTQILLDVVLGKENQGQLTEMAQGLLALKNSRSDESEADEYSVRYLCETDYNASGAAGFFQKLIDAGNGECTGQFMSTHPCPDNRVQAIHDHEDELGCIGTQTTAQYAEILSSLP